MSRHETIVYECDWCKTESPALYPNGRHNDEEMPAGWKEIEYATMCTGCQQARKEAIEYARHMCLNHWPLVMNDAKPATQLEGSSQEKKDG